MKTLYASLKMVSAVILLVVFSAIQSNAQESDDQKKAVKIKMIKSVDGKETVIDTTFEITNLQDLEGLEDIDVIIGDELIENFGIKLSELDENGDGEKHIMSITKEIEEEMGEDGESFQTIDLIVEIADSLDKTKVIKLQMDGDEHTVFVSDDEEIKTIETEDGTKTIIIHKGEGDEDLLFMDGDEVNWTEEMGTTVQVETTDDGNKVIVTDENGEVKEYIIKDGDGAYMIDNEGNLTKVESDEDIIWSESDGENIWVDVETDGDEKVVVIKSKDDKVNIDDMDMEHNVFVEKGVAGEGDYMYISVVEKQEGDKTIVIETKVIIESPDQKDQETMEKAGVDLFPESENNKLEVENLKFSPNPNNGKFKLKFTTLGKGNTVIKIYDINGTEVYSEMLKNFNGVYEKEIDISGEKSGTYFLKVAQGDNIMSRKIVVK